MWAFIYAPVSPSRSLKREAKKTDLSYRIWSSHGRQLFWGTNIVYHVAEEPFRQKLISCGKSFF